MNELKNAIESANTLIGDQMFDINIYYSIMTKKLFIMSSDMSKCLSKDNILVEKLSISHNVEKLDLNAIKQELTERIDYAIKSYCAERRAVELTEMLQEMEKIEHD